MLEVDRIDVAAPAAHVWEIVRHGDLARSAAIRALFAVRAIPDRLAGKPTQNASLRIDGIVSTPERPGFGILCDDPPHEVVVGAIGKVWEPNIPFVHVPSADAFAAFSVPSYAKVAWAVRVVPRGDAASRVEVEVRVDTTDAESWKKFRRYFLLIGPGSRFIRHTLLAALARDLGTPEARENERALPADELLLDATAQLTHGVTIQATPEIIWPWLVQMGCNRAGFYSVDWIDNGRVRSAREIHPELQHIAVGDVLPASPESAEGFEVLAIDRNRTLVLGGLWDADSRKQLPFASARPPRFWQVTWAFVLEPLDATTTRLHVRARAAFSPTERLHLAWIRPVHRLMETVQLRELAARAEGRLPRDDAYDVLEGLSGAARMVLTMLTPFLRDARSHWGVDAVTAAREMPGDAFVRMPRWGWTHGIEIDAPAEAVWPWVAQIGADRGGFYSYQWLENVAGCDLRNAETVHPEWQVRPGDALSMHPKMPPLRLLSIEPGKHMIAVAPRDEAAVLAGKPWMAMSWGFYVEPLGPTRCRFISRLRIECSDDLVTRLEVGPTLIEPVGFVMDRRMLLGVKERATRLARVRSTG